MSALCKLFGHKWYQHVFRTVEKETDLKPVRIEIVHSCLRCTEQRQIKRYDAPTTPAGPVQ